MDGVTMAGLFLAIGAVAGTLAGMLGVGGGLIIVPALIVILPKLGVHDAVTVHLAIGTSLVSIIFTSLSSVWAHNLKGAVLWPVFTSLAPGILVGGGLGAVIADALPARALQNVFGVFELYVAVQMTLNFKPKPHQKLPGRGGMLAAGTVIGTLSALVGIGGGTVSVPFLLWCNTKMKQAVATAAAAGLPVALAGGCGFVLTGLGNAHLPEASLGYVYGPALLGIVLASVLFAPLGAHLAHALPAPFLKRIFAVFLYILAARMLLGG